MHIGALRWGPDNQQREDYGEQGGLCCHHGVLHSVVLPVDVLLHHPCALRSQRGGAIAMKDHNGLNEIFAANAGGGVCSVAYSPDKKKIVAGVDTSIKIFGVLEEAPMPHSLEPGLVVAGRKVHLCLHL